MTKRRLGEIRRQLSNLLEEIETAADEYPDLIELAQSIELAHDAIIAAMRPERSD